MYILNNYIDKYGFIIKIFYKNYLIQNNIKTIKK